MTTVRMHPLSDRTPVMSGDNTHPPIAFPLRPSSPGRFPPPALDAATAAAQQRGFFFANPVRRAPPLRSVLVAPAVFVPSAAAGAPSWWVITLHR